MGFPSPTAVKKLVLAGILAGVAVGAVVSVAGPFEALPGEVAVAVIVALVVFSAGYVLTVLGVLRGE